MPLTFIDDGKEQLDFSDVLIAQNISDINSRKDVKLTVDVTHTGEDGIVHKWDYIPIISANMATSGTITFARILVKEKYLAALEKHIPADEILCFFKELKDSAKADGLDDVTYRNRVFLTIGIRESLDTLKTVNEQYPLYGIILDVPNGTIPNAIQRLKELRQEFSKSFIVAKTVCDGTQAELLFRSGANVVGVSVGCGAVCSTRLKTGVGRPVLSSIADVAEVAERYNGGVLCDGGITCPGDICKALVAGADFIMIGSLFAATEEANDGEVIINNGRKYKQQYGMSSFIAQKKIFNATAEEMAYRTSEGRTKLIPCSGSVRDLIADFNGGIRSCGTYINANCIEDFPIVGRFYKVRRQLNETFANCKDFA